MSASLDGRGTRNDDWFRTLVEHSSTPIFVFRDRLLYANPACATLTGYRSEELATLALARLVPPGHRHGVRRQLRELLAGGSTQSRFEIPLVHQGGTIRRTSLGLTRVVIDGGPALIGTAVDVTEQRRSDQALGESELWFRTLAETTASAIFVYDSERFLYVNRAAERLTGYSAEDLRNLSPVDLSHPDDVATVRERVAQRLGGRAVEAERVEQRILTRKGEERWLDIAAGLLELGGRRAVLGSATDVTERRRVTEALHREIERAQVTLASIGDGVIRTDLEGHVDYLNPVAERLTGWRAADAVGRPLGEVFRILDEMTRRPLPDPVASCLRDGGVVEPPGLVLLVRSDGSEFTIRDTAAPIRNRDGSLAGVVLVFKDITELRELERERVYLAHHDPLTGLLNRREFALALRRCLHTARSSGVRHAVLSLDLEGFKLVNESCGHQGGDEFLRQMAALLHAATGEADTLARLGSDEFGVLLEESTMDSARRLAERLRSEVEAFRFQWEGHVVRVGVSIGLVPVDADSGDEADILRAVDAACYVAREGGRSRIHEYRDDDRAVAERSGELRWIHRIQRAFEEDRFALFHQSIRPLTEGSDREPLAEIFLRMRDVDGHWITPAAFIQAAEKHRLVLPIDRWVVGRALQVLGDGTGEHRGGFTINLSGQSLGERSFLDEVTGAIETSGVEPRRLCFEITETAAVGHLAHATRFISVLKGKGCRFILDDFGSGLSSFAYLKNLDVDFLKIEGDFVREMLKSPVQRALVKSINQIGHDMGIETIAEAVETEAIFKALQELGVDYGQGYWIASPVPLVPTPP